MVLDRKTNFFLGKRWFWTGKPTFSSEKDGLGVKNQLFPRKKMVLARKTNFFLGKTKKNHLFGVWPRSVSTDGFFWFSLGKSWFSFPKASFS